MIVKDDGHRFVGRELIVAGFDLVAGKRLGYLGVRRREPLEGVLGLVAAAAESRDAG